jgi:hypothetical protein
VVWLTCGLPECQGFIAIHPLVGRKVVHTAIGGTNLHVVAIPGVLGEERVAPLVQADDDELPQVLLAPHSVLVHLGRTRVAEQLGLTPATQASHWVTPYLGPAHAG